MLQSKGFGNLKSEKNIAPLCFAVDIDNVLGGAEREVQRLYKDLTGTPWPRGVYGSAGGLDESDLDRELVEGIFSRFHEESIPKLPVLPGAKLALDLLRNRYRILIVTARRSTSRNKTLAWLETRRIPFDDIYHAEDKTAIPERIVLAIDDHPLHAIGYCEKGIPVFLMDQPWNRSVSHPLITRVSGWDDLLQVFHYGAFPSHSCNLFEYPSPRSLFRDLTYSSAVNAVKSHA